MGMKAVAAARKPAYVIAAGVSSVTPGTALVVTG